MFSHFALLLLRGNSGRAPEEASHGSQGEDFCLQNRFLSKCYDNSSPICFASLGRSVDKRPDIHSHFCLLIL